MFQDLLEFELQIILSIGYLTAETTHFWDPFGSSLLPFWSCFCETCFDIVGYSWHTAYKLLLGDVQFPGSFCNFRFCHMFARYALIEIDSKIRGFFAGKSFETVLYGNLVGFDHSGHLWISQFMFFPVLQFFLFAWDDFFGFWSNNNTTSGQDEGCSSCF